MHKLQYVPTRHSMQRCLWQSVIRIRYSIWVQTCDFLPGNLARYNKMKSPAIIESNRRRYHTADSFVSQFPRNDLSILQEAEHENSNQGNLPSSTHPEIFDHRYWEQQRKGIQTNVQSCHCCQVYLIVNACLEARSSSPPLVNWFR